MTAMPAHWWDRGLGDIDTELEVEAVERPHEQVWQTAMGLRARSGKDREGLANDALCLYFGNERNTISTYRSFQSSLYDEGPAGYNVIQACTDTLVAHLVRNKVRPFFLTEKGDSTLQEKARGMQRAVEAEFTRAGIYGDLGMDVCWDGHLFDAGGVKIIPDYNNMRMSVERVFPWEVHVSERDARLGNPRQIFHTQCVDRSTGLWFFRDDKTALRAIADATPAPYDMVDTELSEPGMVADQILWVESWHLPSGRVDRSKESAWGYNSEGEFDPNVDPGHDGRRVICIEGHTLLDEPWPYEYFPFAWFKPMRKRSGYWSRSIPETLAGAQLMLNRMNERIDAIMHLHARPLLYVWQQAKINTNKITNDIAAIIEGKQPAGQAIQYITPQAVPAEYVRRVEQIIEWAEKQVGIPEMHIAASKPPGVDHAPGMQHLSDEGSVRQTPRFRGWENFHIDGSRIMVDGFRLLSKHAKRNGQKFELVWGESKELKRIDWDATDLGEERYHLKVWPTNLFPQTPSAKASRVIDFVKEGIFTREEARAMLDFPDIEAMVGDQTAARENIERRIQRLLDGEPFEDAMPSAYLNLEMAKSITANKINRLEADDEDDEKVDRLRKFYEACDDLQLRETAAAANAEQGIPPEGAPPGPGGGIPAAPPTAPPDMGAAPLPAEAA